MDAINVLLGEFAMLGPLHLAATSYMTGLIWFVQLVHYPGFARVPAEGFVGYTQAHVARTFWVVGPVMIAEATLALALVWRTPAETLGWVGFGLLAVVWLSTAILQVPAHDRLTREHDPAAIARLVRTNWLRTVAWTGRAVVALFLV